jgi:hypothetical protein
MPNIIQYNILTFESLSAFVPIYPNKKHIMNQINSNPINNNILVIMYLIVFISKLFNTPKPFQSISNQTR